MKKIPALRITIMIDTDIIKKIKKSQAQVINDGGSSSFSSEINKVLRRSLKL